MANFSVCFIFPFFVPNAIKREHRENLNSSCPDLLNTGNSDLSEIDCPSFISEVSDQRLLRVLAVITHCNLHVARNNRLLHWMTTGHALTST